MNIKLYSIYYRHCGTKLTFIRFNQFLDVLLHTEIFSESRLFESSEGLSYVGFVVGVDKHRSSVQIIGHVHGLVDVFCEDTWSQAILGTIGTLQHPIYVTVQRKRNHMWRLVKYTAGYSKCFNTPSMSLYREKKSHMKIGYTDIIHHWQSST